MLNCKELRVKLDKPESVNFIVERIMGTLMLCYFTLQRKIDEWSGYELRKLKGTLHVYAYIKLL